MNKQITIHSVFEWTEHMKERCVGVYDSNEKAQACIDRRQKLTPARWRVELYLLNEDQWHG